MTSERATRLRFKAQVNPRPSRAIAPSENVSFIPMECLGADGTLDLSRTRTATDVQQGYTYFEENDVSLAKITPCFENGKGAVMANLAGGVGFGTTELITLRANDDVDPAFLYFVTQTHHFRTLGEAAMTGAGGQKRVPELFVKDYAICWPSKPEQLAIAHFLQVETSRIDSLIKLKSRLLETLAALLASISTEILLGSTRMEPTGNPWCPAVPAGWELRKLKHLGQVRSGIAKGKKYELSSLISLPYLRVANVQDGHIDLSDVAVIEVSENEVERFLLHANDVLMNEGGDYDKVGRGAVWEGQIAPCLHQNHVFAVRLDDPEMAEWVSAITRTAYAKFYFMNNAKQSTNLASISQKNIKEFPVVVPPKEERDRRLAKLNQELAKIAALDAHVRAEIEALAELRSATITDAVLGRIDLPKYQSKPDLEDAAA